MRALFYISDHEWSSSARVFLAAARGLALRGHQAAIACPENTVVHERLLGSDVDTVTVDGGANLAAIGWELRRTLQERFIEVAFVHTDRDQLIVSSAMRLAERGAVIRRIPSFALLEPSGDFLSRKLATAGLLLSTAEEAAKVEAAGWTIPPSVAPLGVDTTRYEGITPFSRESFGARAGAVVVACPYGDSGRFKLATAMRTLALLAPRHPELQAVVFGPGSLDEHLRLHASAVGVNSLFTFIGDPADHAAVLESADIVWVTADHDSGAFACLDAMALRLPVIAERSPLSAHYVADGLTGVLLTTKEPHIVASSVAAVLAHPDRRTTMGNAGRARVQRDFGEAAMIDGFERAGLAAGDRTKWAVR